MLGPKRCSGRIVFRTWPTPEELGCLVLSMILLAQMAVMPPPPGVHGPGVISHARPEPTGCGVPCRTIPLTHRTLVNNAPIAVPIADWSPCPECYPVPRQGAGLTNDPPDSGALLFGGLGGAGLLGDTWILSDRGWLTVQGTQSPPQRELSGLAYDPGLGGIVMFGGLGAKGPLNDTWVFHGGAWVPVESALVPSPRYAVALSYSASLNGVVLFGGALSPGRDLSDTWVFTAGHWTNITAQVVGAPSARSHYGMTWNPAEGHVVLFGGASSGGSLLSDTWSFDGTRWQTINSTGSPPGRADADFVYSPNLTGIVLSAGCCSNAQGVARAYNDTWLLYHGQWAPATPSRPPVPRFQAAAAFDSTKGFLLEFGGSVGQPGMLDTTLELSASGWGTLAMPATPGAREFPMMAYDSQAAGDLLFGGYDPATGVPLGDTWIFGAKRWVEVQSSSSPPPRYGGILCFDPLIGATVLFGGSSVFANGGGATQGGLFNDTWEYAGGAWKPEGTGPAPSPRAGSAASFDDTLGGILLFGGANSTTETNDTWLFNASGWHKLSTGVSPPPRARALSAFDVNRSQFVLFGGVCSPSSCLGTGRTYLDTWLFGSIGWTLVGQSNPSGLDPVGDMMTYDPVIGRIILVGTGVAPGNVTWEFTGGVWSQYDTGALQARTAYGLAFDQSINGPLLFGGISWLGSAMLDTWAFLPTAEGHPEGQLQVSPERLDLGDSSRINVTQNQTYPYTISYPLLPPGCANSNSSDLLCTPTAIGNFSISVRFGDAWTSTIVGTTTIQVHALPRASLSISSSHITLGEAIELNVTLSGGFPPYQVVTAMLPSGCNAPAIGQQCRPSSTGNFKIMIKWMDSIGKVFLSNQVNLTVKPIASIYPAGLIWWVVATGSVTGAVLAVVFWRRIRRPLRPRIVGD